MPLLLILLLALQVPVVPAAEPEIEPALRVAVERFFATQEAEDAAGYLALWSAKAARPRPEQLKYVFESGDDVFSGLKIASARVDGDAARVRGEILRTRTVDGPDGRARTYRSPLVFALSYVREAGEWKLVREGSPIDELAGALIDEPDAEARRALLQSEKAVLTTRLVEALWRRADPLAQQGQHAAAQAIYERSLEAARTLGDRKSEGQSLQNIANSLYFRQQFKEALALYEERLSLEREISNQEGIASALLGIATIRYSAHEYGAALSVYREALAIQEGLDDQVMVSTTLISTGNVLYLQGDYEGAIRDYRRAEEIKRKYFDLMGAATALEGLARVYSAQGDFASALAAFTGVLDERRKRNDIARQAQVLQSIGEVHLRLGNLEQARASFAESRGHFDTARDLASVGRVLQGAALTELVAGQFAAGEKAYGESAAACTSAADHECVARAQTGLAFALSAQQKYDEAIGWYRKAIEGFSALAQKDPVARARIGLAEALSGKEEYDAALEQAERARHAALELTSDDVLWRALVAQARAERKLGRASAALGAARAAVLAVRRMSAAALDRPQRPVPRDTSAAFTTAAILQAEAGDAAAAFETIEASRSHALRLWLVPHERGISRGLTDDERDEERRLAMELTTLLVRKEREASLPKPDTERLAELEAAIEKGVTARNAARERLFARLPDLPVWRGLAPGAGVKDLETLIDEPGTVLLAFAVDDRDVVVITAARPAADEPVTVSARTVPIDRPALGERIGRALDAKSLAGEGAWRKASADLFSLLPSDVVSLVTAADRLIVVPDDVLWRVPFEAMPVENGFLADRTVVTYAASVSAAARPEAAVAEGSVAASTIIAAPELPATLVDELKATAPSWTIRTADAASKEAASVASAFAEPPAATIAGAGATRETLRHAVETSSVLHVATPFRVNSASPLFSPMLLSDGRVEVREIFNIPTSARVVTLSDPAALAMRDGAGALAPVDWAWRAAGAAELVVRRWGGHEEQALTLLGAFYAEMRKGRSAAEALHAARAAVRGTADGRAPAAWAGWLVLSAR